MNGGGGDGPDTSLEGDIAGRNADLAKAALAWAQQQYADAAPYRQSAIAQATKTATQQDNLAQDSTDLAKSYNQLQSGTFIPLAQGIAQQAQAYASPERREQAAADAAAGVHTQMDNANAAMRAKAAANGVDVTSGNYLAQQRAAAVQEGAAAAAAANAARTQVDTDGFNKQLAAAGVGSNMASNGVATTSSALNAGTSAVNNAQIPLVVNANGTQQVQSGYQQAIGANQSAGSLYGQASGVDAQTSGQDKNEMSSLINSGLQAYAAYKSDKNVKSGTGKKMNTAAALGAIVDTPVHEGWSYDPDKGGPDDGGQQHDGPMAQDVRKNMGDDVAPGGTEIDPISMNGMLMAGIQHLAKEVDTLKRKNGGHRAEKGVH
ncbi:MAG: hypothetical protein QM762_08745 [Chryseolinea sp.]